MLIIIGLLFMTFFLLLLGCSMGIVTLFLDLPSLCIILIPLAFFLIVTNNGKLLGNYIKCSFKKDFRFSRTELCHISAAVKSTMIFTLGIGGFAFLYGIICSLNNSGNAKWILVNISVGLIAVLDSFAFSFLVLYPTKVWADNKLNSSV